MSGRLLPYILRYHETVGYDNIKAEAVRNIMAPVITLR